MKYIKLYYSKWTKKFYPTQAAAEAAETAYKEGILSTKTAKFEFLASEFSCTREQYLADLTALRNSYSSKFKQIFDKIEELNIELV